MAAELIPSEHVEQVTVVQWYDAVYGDDMLFAIPNGGKRAKRVAVQMKQEGVRPGVPDLCLPVPRGGYHGLFVEMKRRKGSSTSPAQKRWLERLNALGYQAVVCKGADEAIATIKGYLDATD